jgi:hypothetical protein
LSSFSSSSITYSYPKSFKSSTCCLVKRSVLKVGGFTIGVTSSPNKFVAAEPTKIPISIKSIVGNESFLSK